MKRGLLSIAPGIAFLVVMIWSDTYVSEILPPILLRKREGRPGTLLYNDMNRKTLI